MNKFYMTVKIVNIRILLFLVIGLLFLMSPFSLINNGAAYAQESSSVSVLPLSIGDTGALLAEAKNALEQRDYNTAINRLETIIAMSGQVDDNIREMLLAALEKQLEIEAAKKNYKDAISFNLKIINLQKSFNFVWLNRLLNLYLISGNYRKAHEVCAEILKKQDLLSLSKENLAQIYGKLSVVYSSFLDETKTFESILTALSLDENVKNTSRYFELIFPKNLKYKSIIDYSLALESKKKNKEAYIFALIHSKISDDKASSSEILKRLLAQNPEFKKYNDELSKEKAAQAAAGSSNSASENSNFMLSTSETSMALPNADTSLVLISNVPSKLDNAELNKTNIPTKTLKDVSSDYIAFFERGENLFKNQRYEDAVSEYERALNLAPEKHKKEIERKIFSAYWHSKEEYIKIAVYSTILAFFMVFFYYYNPFSSSSKEQYGLINVSKTMKNALSLMEEKKYQKAISEFEKLSDMKLSNSETVMLFLNMGIAFYNLNSYSSALMALRKVLQYDYENIDAYKFLGKIYLKTKDRTHKAMEVFNFLIDKKIADLETMKIVAAYNAQQNQIDEKTVQLATDIIAVEPDNDIAGKAVIKYFNKIKRSDDEVLKFIEHYTEVYPRDIDCRIILLEVLYRRKDYKHIINECNFLFTYTIDNVLIHSIFIDSIVNLNQPKLLISEYERLLHENPGSIITNFICQSLKSIIIDKKRIPQVDYSIAVRVNFNVCSKCFHLNLNDYNNCQRCGNTLQV